MELNKSIILIVDDDISNIEGVRDVLRISGYEVIVANSASEGMEILNTIKPDVILLDIMMPQIDGLMFCKTLKSNPVYSDIPIIIITGDNSIDNIDKAHLAGASDFVKKPFSPLELETRIKIQIQQKLVRQKEQDEIYELRKQMIKLREDYQKALKSDSGNQSDTN